MNMTFTALGIKDQWTERLIKFNIDSPSPIQEIAIPQLLLGKSAIIHSQTGTGKTLAYLLPILQSIDTSSNQLQSMILAPTAELVMQILKVANDLTEGLGIRVQGIIGGVSLQRQLEKLKQHPHLIIGTPGRILESIKLKKIKMSNIRSIAVDEVDQSIILGTGGEVENIIKTAPGRRQIIFCSATISVEILTLLNKFNPNYEMLEVQLQNKRVDIPSTIEHAVMIYDQRDHIDILRRLLRTLQPKSAILFVNHTNSVAEIISKLQFHGLQIEAVYGDQPKEERASVMRRFRDGKLQYLLSTDLASRGIDAPLVTHVFHLDPPLDAEKYLHRVGRTGRMGRTGISILLLEPRKKFIVSKFAKQLDLHFSEKKWVGGKLINQNPY
jgi:ATP-dependent RNA helicase DeaD